MNLDRYEFQKQLQELCVKCTQLKPSTAKKYANNLFNKFSVNEGCIGFYSDEEFNKKTDVTYKLGQALNTIREGCITSENHVLKLEDVSHVEFKEEVIEVTTKNNKLIRYGKDFEYLKYVFKRRTYYY